MVGVSAHLEPGDMMLALLIFVQDENWISVKNCYIWIFVKFFLFFYFSIFVFREIIFDFRKKKLRKMVLKYPKLLLFFLGFGPSVFQIAPVSL